MPGPSCCAIIPADGGRHPGPPQPRPLPRGQAAVRAVDLARGTAGASAGPPPGRRQRNWTPPEVPTEALPLPAGPALWQAGGDRGNRRRRRRL